MATRHGNFDGLRNFMLAALIFSLIHLKYYVTFTYITQIVLSKAHLKPLQYVVSDKSLIIAESSNFPFAEILNSQETHRRV